MRRRSTITIPKDRETIISEALKREESVRLHRENEATIITSTPLPEPPQPRPYVRQPVSYYQLIVSTIKKELLNICKI